MDPFTEIIAKLALVLFLIAIVFWPIVLCPLWQAMRDSGNMKKAKQDLPVLARELKLRKEDDGVLGKYSGRWNGFRIRVEGHDSYPVTVVLDHNPGFTAVHDGGVERGPFLGNWLIALLLPLTKKLVGKYVLGPGEGERFFFDDPILDNYFDWRVAFYPASAELARSENIRAALHEFLEGNRDVVKGLCIGPEVRCSLWVGGAYSGSWNRSVTGEQARRMLPELMKIAQAMEKAMKAKSNRRDRLRLSAFHIFEYLLVFVQGFLVQSRFHLPL